MTKPGLLLVVLAFGCGAGDPPGPAPVDQTAALCDLYRVACARQAECGVYLYSRTTDPARCEEQLACEDAANGAYAADIEISIPDANACRDTLAAATCEGLVLWDDATGIPSALTSTDPTCQAVFAGQREAGETCGWSQQCQEGLACTGETCPGTCTPVAPQCSIGSCAGSEFCGSDGTCKARAGSGEACGIANDYENACADGLRCDFPFGQTEGTCKPQLTRGSSCNNESFFACENGDVCNNGTCAAPTPESASCGDAFECGIGSYCTFAGGHVCKPQLGIGDPCERVGLECGPNAECRETDHTCQLYGSVASTSSPRPFVGEGEDCELANCEANLACRPSGGQWRCQAAPGLGESCSPDDPNDQVLVLLFGTNGVGGCREGVCDVFGSWTCVVPAAPGATCATPGFTAACASVVCKLDHTCADYFEECPL